MRRPLSSADSIFHDDLEHLCPSVIRTSGLNAFSLIEVVLAIGVVAFALLGIVSLFSSSLKTNKDAGAQQEGFQVQRMLLSRLQDTNAFSPTVLSNMFRTNYCFNPGRTNTLYVYTSNTLGNPTVPFTVLTNAVPASFPLTNGTLYYVLIKQVSTNSFPTNVFSKSGANYIPGDWNNWPAYPAHADVYAIPTPTMTNANFLNRSKPVISFDFIIPK